MNIKWYSMCWSILLSLGPFVNCLKIAHEAQKKKNRFSSLLVYGIVYYLCLQTLISMAVNLGLCPTKGLTLLFVSYGGSSLIMSCLAIGLILRVAKENKCES